MANLTRLTVQDQDHQFFSSKATSELDRLFALCWIVLTYHIFWLSIKWSCAGWRQISTAIWLEYFVSSKKSWIEKCRLQSTVNSLFFHRQGTCQLSKNCEWLSWPGGINFSEFENTINVQQTELQLPGTLNANSNFLPKLLCSSE